MIEGPFIDLLKSAGFNYSQGIWLSGYAGIRVVQGKLGKGHSEYPFVEIESEVKGRLFTTEFQDVAIDDPVLCDYLVNFLLPLMRDK